MLPITDKEKFLIWNALRSHRDYRLRARDIPMLPFFLKPVVGAWTVKVGSLLEWLIGPDPGVI